MIRQGDTIGSQMELARLPYGTVIITGDRHVLRQVDGQWCEPANSLPHESKIVLPASILIPKQPGHGFWEYEDAEGNKTHTRIWFFVWGILAGALIGLIPALIGGIHIWWPAIFPMAAAGATGALIANAIDYISDNRRATRG